MAMHVIRNRIGLLCGFADHPRTMRDVAPDRLPREQMRLLKHHAEIGPRTMHRQALHQYLALEWHLESGDRIEHRRFAAPGRPDDADEFTVRHVERNSVHRNQLAAIGVKDDAEI